MTNSDKRIEFDSGTPNFDWESNYVSIARSITSVKLGGLNWSLIEDALQRTVHCYEDSYVEKILKAREEQEESDEGKILFDSKRLLKMWFKWIGSPDQNWDSFLYELAMGSERRFCSEMACASIISRLANTAYAGERFPDKWLWERSAHKQLLSRSIRMYNAYVHPTLKI